MRVLKRLIAWLAMWAVVATVAFYALCIGGLAALRWVNPWTTTVQVQRRIEALAAHKRYTKRYTFVRLSRIAPSLQHAVIAAEDGRFYQHHGIDWKEVQKVVDADLEEGQLGRG